MAEPVELLGPVALTPAKLEQQLRGPETDYAPRLVEAFRKVSAGCDVMVLEGGRSLREGYVAGLPPRRVVELLEARVLLVLKHDDSLMVDRALTAQDYFGPALAGVAINDVPRNRLDGVHETVTPFLARHGLRVMGVLPANPLLAAPTVAELAEGLNAEILCCADQKDVLVEDRMVGAMSAESALSYFRRKPNKAVVTGGDRADIQMAALETSTRCLILTGNLYPNPMVLHRAEDLNVPVLLARQDTFSTVEIIEGYFGRSRFQHPQKLELFAATLEANFDFPALYQSLELIPG
jgi:BioD-like phosphotransacetylase family protein